jgi:hypothetical protein
MQYKKMTPKEYEQLFLPKLIKENEKSIEWLRSNSLSTTKNFSSGYIATVINQLKEYEKYFLTYESLSQYLAKADLPQMSKELANILLGISDTIKKYQQIYQDALAMENWRPPMPPFYW